MSETLTYAPRKAIKSQALVDFVVEWTDSQLPPAQVQAEPWTMYFDGSLMKTGAGRAYYSSRPWAFIWVCHQDTFCRIQQCRGVRGPCQQSKDHIELGVRRLDVRGDSQLVLDQVIKASNCHDLKMEAYCREVRRLKDKFHGLELVHIA